MAARNFAPMRALEREVVKIFGGGTGAGTDALTALVGVGITSIDQTGTGLYTVTLSDKYAALLMLSACVIDATSPDDWEVVVVAEDVDGAKTIDLAIFKGGSLTDLTTDEKLRLEITLSNTSQLPSGR